jgi:hypothetical protein
MSALRAVIDGSPLPDDEARALWKRFSTWMDAHEGDLAGFARAEGLVSVHPEMRGGSPVLVGSGSDPQRPYGTAAPGTGPKTHAAATKRKGDGHKG